MFVWKLVVVEGDSAVVVDGTVEVKIAPVGVAILELGDVVPTGVGEPVELKVELAVLTTVDAVTAGVVTTDEPVEEEREAPVLVGVVLGGRVVVVVLVV